MHQAPSRGRSVRSRRRGEAPEEKEGKLENEIGRLEEEIADIEKEMCRPEIMTDHVKLAELSEPLKTSNHSWIKTMRNA